MMNRARLLVWLFLLPTTHTAFSDIPIEMQMVHLRIDGPREWSVFPDAPAAQALERNFNARPNATPLVLRLRHQDVKQTWDVQLNGNLLGRLRIDENDMIEYFIVPIGSLIDGRNTLVIAQDLKRSRIPDDINVGDILLHEASLDDVLNEARIRISVKSDHRNNLPARITVTNASGALQTVGAESNDHLAVRPGIVYTSTGFADFGVPAGEYTITVGRGFEYSIATTNVHVTTGESVTRELSIQREVNTEGYVACDTHVHTLTHSGHGDATVRERMITLAGEGIEVPIATDHNAQIDHRPYAEAMQVASYFTPVIGNEVTTSVGHFNIWPVDGSAAVPDHRSNDWNLIFDEIYRTPGARVVILNHARDLHGGTIPFGPKMHNAVAGANLNGWPIRFNGMEVINSGATQSELLQLCHDWMALLNAGHQVSPVGCSDSHDVGRHFVGQGRTYIRCDDRDPSQIDVDRVAEAFIRGEVMVSYGLLCEMRIDERYGSGATVQPSGETLQLSVRVAGPHWTTASQVYLFANGELIRSQSLVAADAADAPIGTHAIVNWEVDLPKHDTHLVAIAIGPGVDGLHWKTAKPYQPDSPNWEAHTLGVSGAIWIDADKDGRRWSAIDYARDVVATASGDLTQCLALLESYDESVAIQTAHQLQLAGLAPLSDTTLTLVSGAAEHVRRGFQKYQLQWRENQLARSSQ
jgi:hypothetical protein